MSDQYELWRRALSGHMPADASDEAMKLARETWALADAAIDDRFARLVGRVVWFGLGLLVGRLMS